MNEMVQIGKELINLYAFSESPKRSFSRVGWVSDDCSGAADYLALLAYPLESEDSKRINFKNAMLSALVRSECKGKGMSAIKAKMIEQFGLSDLMIWRDIDRALTGSPNKLGGGVKKLKDRLHSHHVFVAYDSSLSQNAGCSFNDVLSHISSAYESRRSTFQEPDFRLDNLKKIFRASRPVIHLTYGYVISCQSIGLANDLGQVPHINKMLRNPNWLGKALELSEVVLGLQLYEYESELKTGKKLRGHKFNPTEVVHLKPMVSAHSKDDPISTPGELSTSM
ncbi:hypothetical protein M2404_001229 [Rheinheimera pacifica]|uniref:hypothetical protein n=1 Tax=Rheinheimera pacifica TaxID=173990 RepID=UPI0021677365|nr:hypothetical protein [Rheinheimera pacifica]MCS4306904.1 hypothetical protein [Rheinheimera pacifica]